MEQWIRWKPINDLAIKYRLDSLYQSSDKFHIVLSDIASEKPSLHITGWAAQFQKKLLTPENISYILPGGYVPDCFSKWTCFEIKNSHYIKKFDEQSPLLASSHFSRKDDDFYYFKHFAFMTDNALVKLIGARDVHITLKD